MHYTKNGIYNVLEMHDSNVLRGSVSHENEVNILAVIT
jgi:hypothetical protein